MKLQINKDQISSITQHNEKICRYYDEWTEAGRDTWFFGLVTINKWEAGYYSSFLPTYRTKEEWEKEGLYEKEPKGGLYYYPHLIITMSSGEDVNKSFKSITEMEWWKVHNLKGVNLIEIID